MSVKDEGEEVGTRGRSRRSAAAAGQKAWAALMPKHKVDDEENDAPPAAPRSTPRAKKVKTEAASPTPTKPKVASPQAKGQKRAAADTSPAVAKKPLINPPAKQTNGAAAMGKEQLANIEKEMYKTYMSSEDDEFDFDDDDLDEEYEATPKASKGAAKGRASTARKPAAPAKPQAAAAFNQQYTMKNMLSRTTVVQKPPNAMPPRIPIRPPGGLRYAAPTYATAANESRPLKMFVLRPPGKTAEGKEGVGSTPLTISSMAFPSTKEIEELNKKFGDRLVAGESVEKFNGLITVLHEELKLMAEDRQRMVRNHEEMVEQMALSHSAALDLKDSRIRQLDSFVGSLQSKISLLTAQLQASLCEHESSKAPAEGANSELPKTIRSTAPAAAKAGGDQPPVDSDEPMDSAEAAAEREELGEFDSSEGTAEHSPQAAQ